MITQDVYAIGFERVETLYLGMDSQAAPQLTQFKVSHGEPKTYLLHSRPSILKNAQSPLYGLRDFLLNRITVEVWRKGNSQSLYITANSCAIDLWPSRHKWISRVKALERL